MPKKRWNTVVDDAIAAYKSGKYAYFYGAKNVELTEDRMNQLIAAEPSYFSKYSKSELEQIKRNSIGRIGVDCSAFTGWVCTGDEQWSQGQIVNCFQYNTLAGGPTASILFTTWGGHGRHIGLDIGNGYCLQAGWEATDAKVREGRAGIYLSPISATAWEKSGQSNVVDYTGVYSPYGPTTKLVNGDKPIPLAVGDAVRFVGPQIFVSSYKNSRGVAVPNFNAKIIQKNDKTHPFLIRSTGYDGFEGWADEKDLVRV